MDSFDQLQTVALALAAVLSCVFALSLIAKHLRQRVGVTESACEILSSTYLGPKERVILLRVHDKQVLIGVGPTHMCALGEFSNVAMPVSSVSKGDAIEVA
jgi:flagellar biogenesis protein FliO